MKVNKSINMKGNCYVASEALYHLLGGKAAGYKAMYLKHEGSTHWYLQHQNGIILDPTVSQFKSKPDYSKGKGIGFLTKEPSKRTKELMDKIIWTI